MLRTTRASSDIRLGSQGGSQTTLTSTFPTPGTVETAFSTITGFLRRRAIGRGQRHVDFHRAVAGDVDAVNQTDLVDVGRNFRVIDGLERGHDLVVEPGDLGLRQRGISGRRGLRALGGLFNGGRVVTHAKNSRALTMDSASVSTSSFVL